MFPYPTSAPMKVKYGVLLGPMGDSSLRNCAFISTLKQKITKSNLKTKINFWVIYQSTIALHAILPVVTAILKTRPSQRICYSILCVCLEQETVCTMSKNWLQCSKVNNVTVAVLYSTITGELRHNFLFCFYWPFLRYSSWNCCRMHFYAAVNKYILILIQIASVLKRAVKLMH